ncbi:hypothetical protein XBFM1_2510043 [Xenorhabdus bovienii str. feltiae Moldova]|uniref:Uncharacterized protein n=1 Tax=Xenorhabdus bovienii str. feltiae Moldova TaxID=1398200 RepID=A0A077NUW3_XENBV|nr:hypothetical protein XBFM1_2510043 [Xenorhabdus bovienii str. feltiae Moldova]
MAGKGNNCPALHKMKFVLFLFLNDHTPIMPEKLIEGMYV